MSTLSFGELIRIIKDDIYRTRRKDVKLFIISLMKCRLQYPWYNCVYYYRLCNYSRQWNISKYTIYIFFRLMKRHYDLKYMMDIEVTATIGGGLRIAHPGLTFISPGTIIGKNCTISNQCLLGWLNRGEKKGVPVSIGDNVFIGPGAKILGRISIGNDVVIGANTLVIKDIPDNATVLGVPARIVSYEGSDSGHCNQKT